jgi:hypothetical protein
MPMKSLLLICGQFSLSPITDIETFSSGVNFYQRQHRSKGNRPQATEGCLMRKARDWLAGRSWWTVAAILAVVFAAGVYGFDAAIRPNHVGWVRLVAALGGGVLYGACMALFFRSQQRKYGGQSTSRAIEKAIKAGELPESVQPEIWLPLLERKRRSDRFMAWAGPVEFALFTALDVYLIATQPGVWFWGVSAAGFAGLGIWIPFWTVRRKPKIDALIAQLKTQEPGRSPV